MSRAPVEVAEEMECSDGGSEVLAFAGRGEGHGGCYGRGGISGWGVLLRGEGKVLQVLCRVGDSAWGKTCGSHGVWAAKMHKLG